jgi:hypothetical protein
MTMNNSRENSLFDTGLKLDSLFDTGQYFLPYMTSSLNLFPYMTLLFIFFTDGVKERHEKTSLPLIHNDQNLYITIATERNCFLSVQLC